MNKLAELRKTRNLSQEELARKLNTSSVSIGRYEREDQRLSLPILRKLAVELDCTIGEIAGEEGTLRADRQLTEQGFAQLPVYDIRAAAGAGAVVAYDEDPIDHLAMSRGQLRTLTKTPERLLAVLRVAGDSMEPTLTDGDWIVVDTQRNRIAGDGLYVLSVEGELVIKRASVHPETREITVISDNSRYPSYKLSGPANVLVRGRVIMMFKRA